jgi:hypothetical protein
MNGNNCIMTERPHGDTRLTANNVRRCGKPTSIHSLRNRNLDSTLLSPSCYLALTPPLISDIGPPAAPPIDIPLSKLALIADTGSTAHFCPVNTPVINKRATNVPIAIHNPNGTIMHSRHEAKLDIPFLPKAAEHVPDLLPNALISIGKLCDSGCDVGCDVSSIPKLQPFSTATTLC